MWEKSSPKVNSGSDNWGTTRLGIWCKSRDETWCFLKKNVWIHSHLWSACCISSYHIIKGAGQAGAEDARWQLEDEEPTVYLQCIIMRQPKSTVELDGRASPSFWLSTRKGIMSETGKERRGVTRLAETQKYIGVLNCQNEAEREGKVMWFLSLSSFFWGTTTDVVILVCITGKAYICGRDVEPVAGGLKQHPFYKPLLSLLTACSLLMQKCHGVHSVIAGLKLL